MNSFAFPPESNHLLGELLGVFCGSGGFCFHSELSTYARFLDSPSPPPPCGLLQFIESWAIPSHAPANLIASIQQEALLCQSFKRGLRLGRLLQPGILFFDNLAARRSPPFTIPFRIRTSAKPLCNSFRIRTSKTKHFNPFRMRTSKKNREGGAGSC